MSPGDPRGDERLLAALDELVAHHRRACPPYERLLRLFHPDTGPAERLEDLPWLPASLFKEHELRSVPPEQVFRVLRSSGTTGLPSRVTLDRPTAQAQALALARAMRALLGPARRPMLIVDRPSVLRPAGGPTARTAGVLGMMPFGRDHHFLLDEDERPALPPLRAWLARHAGQDLFVFGFTAPVWTALRALEVDLSRAVLVHGGGWKRLQAEAVDRAAFRAGLRAATGVERVHDFYGMVEQVGTVYLEGEDGLLHPGETGTLIIRDPLDLRPLPEGEVGLVQALSTLPRSYPGHSLLTEDLGSWHALPGGGRAFRIHGRLPRAEARGCSDALAPPGGEAR